MTLICDEWNYNPISGFALSNKDEVSEKQKVAYFSTMTNEIGAAFRASVLCTFQNSSNDIAAYYDSQPTNLWCGIFDRYGVPTKPYYAFCAFNGFSVKQESGVFDAGFGYAIAVPAGQIGGRYDLFCLTGRTRLPLSYEAISC